VNAVGESFPFAAQDAAPQMIASRPIFLVQGVFVVAFLGLLVPTASFTVRLQTDVQNATTSEDDEVEEVDTSREALHPRLHVRLEVAASLRLAEQRRSSQQDRLTTLRQHCSVSSLSCAEQVEMAAAKLRYFTIAVAQLRQREAGGADVEADDVKAGEAVQKLQGELDTDLAKAHFEALSEVDAERKRAAKKTEAEGYASEYKKDQENITLLSKRLGDARMNFSKVEEGSMRFLAEARSIDEGVNASDGFAEEEFGEAERRDHMASALFRKAKLIAKHTRKMMNFHADNFATKDEASEVRKSLEKVEKTNERNLEKRSAEEAEAGSASETEEDAADDSDDLDEKDADAALDEAALAADKGAE